MSIFGDDYPTADGTCIRDYIHVMDLAEAHGLALTSLSKNNKSHILNLGNGAGFSVKEVVETFEKIIGKELPKEVSQRRLGDPATLVAESISAKKELSWQPKYSDLQTIIESAWTWHNNNPNGY